METITWCTVVEREQGKVLVQLAVGSGVQQLAVALAVVLVQVARLVLLAEGGSGGQEWEQCG